MTWIITQSLYQGAVLKPSYQRAKARAASRVAAFPQSVSVAMPGRVTETDCQKAANHTGLQLVASTVPSAQ